MFVESCHILFTTGLEQHFNSDESSDYMIAIRRSKANKPSYVDKLLFFAPYFYRNSVENILVATSNYKDVPFEFYDRVGIVVSDDGKETSIEGFYRFNFENFKKLIKHS